LAAVFFGQLVQIGGQLVQTLAGPRELFGLPGR